jgi:hypothetical protein
MSLDQVPLYGEDDFAIGSKRPFDWTDQNTYPHLVS